MELLDKYGILIVGFATFLLVVMNLVSGGYPLLKSMAGAVFPALLLAWLCWMLSITI